MLAAAAGLLSLLLFSDQFRSFLRTQIFVGAPDVYIGPPVTYTAPAAYLIDNTTQTGQGFAASSGGRQGWTYDTTSGYEKDYHWSYPGRGENKATWTFGKLPPGQYLVQATWTANSRRATNAPYTVSDGKSALLTTTVNQRSAPLAGTAAGSITFQNLGSPVTTTSGTVKVTLTNAANGYVAADAVRVASIIKAQTPNEASLSGQDWSLPEAPGVDVTLGEPFESCPAPIPAGEADIPLSLSRPIYQYLLGNNAQAQVLCQRGHIGVLPRKYESRTFEHRWRTNVGSVISNPSASDIITAICHNPPPGCSPPSISCSNLTFTGKNIRLGALWEKLNNLYRLVAGTVYPGPNQAGVAAQAVYPAAPETSDRVLVFINEMRLWGLSPTDESVLRAAHPALVSVANAVLSGVETHEEGHLAIFERSVPLFMDVINNPRVPGPQPSLASLQSAIKSSYDSKWLDVKGVVDTATESFHDDVMPKEDLTIGRVPVGGQVVNCKFAADFVTNVGVVIDPLKAGFVSSRPLGTTRSGVTGIDGCEAQCSVIYLTGTQVTMLATPKSGYRFAKWLGDACPCNRSSSNKCSFTVSSADSSCTALFAKGPAIQPPPPTPPPPPPPPPPAPVTPTPLPTKTPTPTPTATS